VIKGDEDRSGPMPSRFELKAEGYAALRTLTAAQLKARAFSAASIWAGEVLKR
jgi:hypothetical protein